LIGCPISMSFATSRVCLELGSLPSTRVTRFAVLRTSPPPQSARPVPHGRPVGPVIPDLTTLGSSRVACAFLVYVLPPLPRRSGWASSSLLSPSRISLPRSRCRVGLHIVLFEDCSEFSHFAARTLARSPICDQLHRRLQPFCDLHDCSGYFRLERLPGGACTTGKRRLVTAHTLSGHCVSSCKCRLRAEKGFAMFPRLRSISAHYRHFPQCQADEKADVTRCVGLRHDPS
jgi:hypothetical protein